MENKRNQCNGTLKVQETPDGRDIYICSKCGQQSRFDFNMKCKKVIEKSTRELAFEWWRKLKYDSPIHLEYYAKKYYKRDWDSLTGKEVEEIWLKETTNLEEIAESIYKPNQKQFKQFNAELFKAYINKFSHEDKLKCVKLMLNTLSSETYENFINNYENKL